MHAISRWGSADNLRKLVFSSTTGVPGITLYPPGGTAVTVTLSLISDVLTEGLFLSQKLKQSESVIFLPLAINSFVTV